MFWMDLRSDIGRELYCGITQADSHYWIDKEVLQGFLSV